LTLKISIKKKEMIDGFHPNIREKNKYRDIVINDKYYE